MLDRGLDARSFFTVFNGVRQGSVLSPVIFNVFINIFITQLRQLNIGCHLRSMFIGCLMYADDMILISPSVRKLQHMLDTCIQYPYNLMRANHIVWQ